MTDNGNRRIGFLEALLLIAIITLTLQLFPMFTFSVLRAANPRGWTREVWMALTVATLFVLLAIRFVPGLLDDWRRRNARLAAEHEKRQKQLHAKEQREAIQRLHEGRKRRIF